MYNALSFYKNYYEFQKSTNIFYKLNITENENLDQENRILKSLANCDKSNKKSLINKPYFKYKDFKITDTDMIIKIDFRNKDLINDLYPFNYNIFDNEFVKENKNIQEFIKNNKLSINTDHEKFKTYILLIKNNLIKEDFNDFLISLYHIEVSIEDKEESNLIIYPIIFLNIDTKTRISLLETILDNNDFFELKINLNEEKIIFNKEILETFFESELYIQLRKNNLSFLLNSEHIGNSSKELFFFKYIQNEFSKYLKKPKIENISYHLPDFSNGIPFSYPISWVFNKINTENNTNDFEEIINKKISISNALEEYLLSNEKIKLNQKFKRYYGTNTEQYALAAGQAKVLSTFNNGESLIPVIGAPGTGKTTLFKSIISNIITNRALENIILKKDTQKIILMTSTANKAIENVFQDIYVDNPFAGMAFFSTEKLDAFKKNIVNDLFVPFNEKEKRISIFKNKNTENIPINLKLNLNELTINVFIEYIKKNVCLKTKLFDHYEHISYNTLESKIINHKEIIDNKVDLYNEISNKLMSLDIFSIKDLLDKESRRDKQAHEKYLSIVEPIIKLINKLSNKEFSFKNITNIIKSNNFYKIKEVNQFIFKNKTFIFKVKNFFTNQIEKNIKTIATTIGLDLSINKEYLIQIIDLLSEVEDNIESFKKYEFEYIELEKIMELTSFDKIFLNDIFKYKTEEEFFQLSECIFKENYILYKLSEAYLILKEYETNKYLEENLNLFNNLLNGNIKNINKSNINEILRVGSIFFPVLGISTAKLNHKKFVLKQVKKIGDIKLFCLLADEAGMIPSGDLIWGLNFVQKALIVGDPKQLPPIENFLEELKPTFLTVKNISNDYFNKYAPSEVSAYIRAAGCDNGKITNIGKGIILDEHRRCQKPIAELFKIIAGYPSLLKIKTEQFKGNENKVFKQDNELKFLSFYTYEPITENKIKNTNLDEVDIIVDILNKLENEMGYNLKEDIGIITPYKSQANLLISKFKNLLNHSSDKQKIGTVHSFQGAEFPVIIYSSVINSLDKNNINFVLNNVPLLNVSISRAKTLYIHVGDSNYMKQNSSFSNIYLPHFEKYGSIIEARTKKEILLANNSLPINTTEHKNILSDSKEIAKELIKELNNAQNKVLFIVPWISESALTFLKNNLSEQQLKNIDSGNLIINIFFFYKDPKNNEIINKDPKKCELNAKAILKKLGLEKIKLNIIENGTHEKIVVFDRKKMFYGSFNYLSSSAYKYLNSNFTLRNESSLIIEGSLLWDILQTRYQTLNISKDSFLKERIESGF